MKLVVMVAVVVVVVVVVAVGRLTVERYAFTFYKLELVPETKYFMVCVGSSLVSTGRCRARAGKG